MKTRKKGCFITFEGIDGCGKSTQLKMARKFLKDNSFSVTVIREPGSTPLSNGFHIDMGGQSMTYTFNSNGVLNTLSYGYLGEDYLIIYLYKPSPGGGGGGGDGDDSEENIIGLILIITFVSIGAGVAVIVVLIKKGIINPSKLPFKRKRKENF